MLKEDKPLITEHLPPRLDGRYTTLNEELVDKVTQHEGVNVKDPSFKKTSRPPRKYKY